MQTEPSKETEARTQRRRIPYGQAFMQLFHFGYQQAMSCIFPVAIFGTLAVSKWLNVPFIHRYDLILLVVIAVQYLMFRSRLETLDM